MRRRSVGGLLSALLSRRQKEGAPLSSVGSCLLCGASMADQKLYDRFRVCPNCRFHYSISSRERVRLLTDPKSFKEKFSTVSSLDPLSFKGKVPYRKRLFKDQRRTRSPEAAMVGRSKIGGVRNVLVTLDFGFMGGSMGCVVGEKVTRALEYATKKSWPLVAVVSSAGTRMQEGVLSLMQMAKTTTAANQLHHAGIPYICVLTSPTTGQAYASFVNLADILIAEPRAILGFSPMKALQSVTDGPLPQGAHTAEAHLAHGLIDLIVDREALQPTLASLLALLSPTHTQANVRKPKGRDRKITAKDKGASAWELVQQAREGKRPTARDYINLLFNQFVELHGDRFSTDDQQVICGLADLAGRTVMVIGQIPIGEANGSTAESTSRPGGFRKAQRAMRLAAKFRIPVVTLIDTPGPSASLEAEDQGIGNAIATTMSLMAELPVPTVAAIIGQGGREGALALGIADRILMMENAVLLPISPEGAATLMYRDSTRVEEASDLLRLTAADCLDMEIVDSIVPEPNGSAQANPEEAAHLLRRSLLRALAGLQKLSPNKLLKARHKRFRNMGEYTSHFRMVLARELEALRDQAVERGKKGKKGKEGKVLQLPKNPVATTPAGAVDAPVAPSPNEPSE